MKIFKYFISKIILRKAVLGISMILLLCMANYITFTSSRSILSTYQGYQETKYINQEGNYIANLDLGEKDMTVLKRWHKAAARAGTIKEFQDQM